MKLLVFYKDRRQPRLFSKVARTIKLTGILLIMACLQVSATTYAQKITISERNASLEKVFQEIMKQSEYSFLYKNEILHLAKNVSIEAKNASIESVLAQCFKDQAITYSIFEKTVIIKAKTSEKSRAMPPKIIKGRIVDDKGEVLPGVSMILKGTSVSVATNVKGEFSISVPEEQATTGVLVVSFIGFQKQEVVIGNRTNITIRLLPETTALSEVVVTVGYGTQKRGDVSQAIASVNVEKLKDVPVTNLSTALQGRVAGLVATPSSYRPGSGASIRIRGNRSLSATNDPLYVVDGIPITYSIDDINPLDIESIDVLKDAAATAIYGSRGANGVIQITTKKGKKGKISVDYSGTSSMEKILNPVEVYNGQEFAQFRRDAFIGSGVYNPSNSNTQPKFYFPDPASDYKTFTSTDNALWNNIKNAYTFTELDPANNIFNAQTRPTTAEEKAFLQANGYPVLDNVAIYDPSKITTYDWSKDALQTGLTQNHNLSVSGGSDKFSSSFSGGYYKQKGINPGQDYTRFSISNNNNFRPVTFINVGTNINYSNAIQNRGPDVYNAALGQFPLAKPYDENGNFVFNPGGDAQVANPLNDPNTVFNEFRINRLLSNVFAQVNIVKGLSYKTAFGIDLNNVRQGVFNGSISSVRLGNQPNAQYRASTGFVWTLQNQLNYSLTIGSKHEITATAVQELRKDRFEENFTSAENLTYESQKWYALQNNTQSVVSETGTFRQNQLVSYLGRLNYAYAGKYVLTAALRHDASSVLAVENNGQYFPSASVAWKLDQESFMKNIAFIDQLKLRGGIGSVGNSGIDPYLTSGILNPVPSYYNFGDAPIIGYAPLSLPLPNLTWEKTTTKNIGLDFGFFKSRISGSIDVYESNTNNIQNKSIPGASGFSKIYVNLGKVRNRGLEVALSSVNIDKSRDNKGFKWTTDIAFSANKEAIVSLSAAGTDDIANQWFLGRPIRSYNDFQSEGIFQYADTLSGGILKDYFWKRAGNKSNPNFQPGRIRVQDVNGDTVITDVDKVNLGSANPKWTASFNNTFSFKGFDLSTFVYFSQGALLRDIRPGLVGRYPGVKVNYWTPDNPSNEYQQPNRGSDIPLYWQALTFRDASFVRVRNIMLAYHLPASVLNKIKISNMIISFNAVNPFLFSKYDRYDPETVPYTSTYPSSSTDNPAPTSFSYRSFVFGLRMSL